MKDFRITSAMSTDVVTLGQTRIEVRRTLGSFRDFRRTATSPEADDFFENGTFATYSSTSGRLIMLEFVDPARVYLAGVQLVGEPLERAHVELQSRGIGIDFDELGATIPDFALEIYAPSGIVEGVQLGAD